MKTAIWTAVVIMGTGLAGHSAWAASDDAARRDAMARERAEQREAIRERWEAGRDAAPEARADDTDVQQLREQWDALSEDEREALRRRAQERRDELRDRYRR